MIYILVKKYIATILFQSGKYTVYILYVLENNVMLNWMEYFFFSSGAVVFLSLSVKVSVLLFFFLTVVSQWAGESLEQYVFVVVYVWVCVCVWVCLCAHAAQQDSEVKVSVMSSGMTGNNEPYQVQ